MSTVDVISHNAEAWDLHVKNAWQWTVPVSHEEIEAARAGLFSILLTAKKPVPREWFPEELAGLKILCLASGGGQQAPILAAAGADVTVFDNSLAQLTQDRLVSQRENLPLKIVWGDMRDLSAFADGAFDLVFCPVSVTYIPQVQPVFDEAYRVLRKGGSFLFGATNPFVYIFDGPDWDQNRFTVSNHLPFCSLDELSPEEVSRVLQNKETIQYSHTLESLIGGQTAAGFAITGFYEDVAHLHQIGGDVLLDGAAGAAGGGEAVDKGHLFVQLAAGDGLHGLLIVAVGGGHLRQGDVYKRQSQEMVLGSPQARPAMMVWRSPSTMRGAPSPARAPR